MGQLLVQWTVDVHDGATVRPCTVFGNKDPTFPCSESTEF